jgi:glycosyltransferase involved in cell wall biosynthesis
LRRRALQQADFTISISEYTKQLAININHMKSERAYLLPNALEHQTSQPAGPTSRRPAFLPNGTLLLSVCRLDKLERYKGVDTVIEALPAVLSRAPDVHYLVVGSGTDLDRHKQLAKNCGVADRVHFLGSVDEAILKACYQACDVFVLPSSCEGFGFVFLEAMQYGKPVVAADSGGAPEVVKDGMTGVLVKYGVISHLAQALIDLCLNPTRRAALGQAGQERVRERHAFSQFKKTLMDILSREIPSVASNKNHRHTIADVTRSF